MKTNSKARKRNSNREFYFNEYKEESRRRLLSGKLSKTLALFPVGPTSEATELQIWESVIDCCFLNDSDLIAKWKESFNLVWQFRDQLNDLQVDTVRIHGTNVDLQLAIGDNRQWLGASGRNIPSFEIFTSPDYRSVNGYIKFDLPANLKGKDLHNLKLEFKDGQVVNYAVDAHSKVLERFLSIQGADFVGEISLTDKRTSRLTKSIGVGLYDENIGGNTHIALGNAYKQAAVDADVDLHAQGFNESVEHKDFIFLGDFEVSAKLRNGDHKLLFAGGEFQFTNL
jgi:aminopeptidase